MGAISGAGIGIDALWRAARSGTSGIREAVLERPGSNRVKIAAQVPGFKPEQHVDSGILAQSDRFTQLAIVAADEAMSQAALARGERLGARTAVIVGTGIGGFLTIDELSHAFYVSKARLDPMGIPRAMSNGAASLLSMRYGCTGPTFAVVSACSSANQAIGMGALLIRSGIVERAIVGGSEAGISASFIRAWEVLRVLTPDFCRPFSNGRNGMVLGEGAGIFVLESEKTSNARGAAPIAVIAGYGTSSDANDIVRPDVAGATSAMQLALADAGCAPEDIDYVNAHGTGTVMNDITESEALRRVFGARLPGVAVSSTKPIHGHALGAAGALELAVTIMALRENVAPPTINWTGRDPKCDLDPVPNEARELPIRAAMSNSFAFGGINASLVVTRAD
jgi:nodulation protein E